jgi:hypothetical protein
MLLGWPLLSRAQAPEIGLWSGVNLQKKLNRSFTLHGHVQARLSENLTVARSYLAEAGLTYKLSKHWEVSGYYRYSLRRKPDGDGYTYRPYHRFYADVSYDHDIWKLKFDYRLRYQNQFKDESNGLESTSSYLRNKFELSYPNKSRFKPYLSTDVFYEVGGQFDQLRNKAGVEIKLNRQHRLDVYGFTDYQLVGRQKNQLIFGLMYKIKL